MRTVLLVTYEQGTGVEISREEIEVPDREVSALEKLTSLLELKGYLTKHDVTDVLGA